MPQLRLTATFLGVGTKAMVFDKELPLLLTDGLRGTNAEVRGYVGNPTP